MVKSKGKMCTTSKALKDNVEVWMRTTSLEGVRRGFYIQGHCSNTGTHMAPSRARPANTGLSSAVHIQIPWTDLERLEREGSMTEDGRLEP